MLALAGFHRQINRSLPPCFFSIICAHLLLVNRDTNLLMKVKSHCALITVISHTLPHTLTQTYQGIRVSTPCLTWVLIQCFETQKQRLTYRVEVHVLVIKEEVIEMVDSYFQGQRDEILFTFDCPKCDLIKKLLPRTCKIKSLFVGVCKSKWVYYLGFDLTKTWKLNDFKEIRI